MENRQNRMQEATGGDGGSGTGPDWKSKGVAQNGKHPKRLGQGEQALAAMTQGGLPKRGKGDSDRKRPFRDKPQRNAEKNKPQIRPLQAKNGG
jgi:hypothetical protein